MLIEKKLEALDIKYDIVEHVPVYTVEEAKEKVPHIDGIGCKNLFLKTQKKELFLYTVKEDKQINLKCLSEKLQVTRFHFASPETLEEILGVIPGSVTPLAIINDQENKVVVVLDKELQGQKILVHPNRNTATISIAYEDLIKFIKSENHKLIEI